MRSDFPEIVKFSEIDSYGKISCSKRDRLLCLIDYFKRDDVFESLVSEANLNGYVLVPSIYGINEARCNMGFFCGQNVLIFKDGKKRFAITQLSCLLYGILDFEDFVFYSQEINPERQSQLIKNILIKLTNFETNKEGRFLGVINGYQRPYHYFYDKAPFVFMLEESTINKTCFLSVREKAFLPAQFFGAKQEVVVDDLDEYIFSRGGFVLDVGYPYLFKRKSFINDEFDKIIEKSFNFSLDLNGHSGEKFFIWFGVCQEKRRWVERVEAIKILIAYLLNVRNDFVFIFDGLTRPFYEDEEKFFGSKKVKEEINIVEYIRRSFPGINAVSLVGATAVEKMHWAFNTDFFITNALTDSMWCSRFAKKRGICYSAISSKTEVLRQHRHPNSTFIPYEMITDVGKPGENWSKMDFSIDPAEFLKFTISNFSEYLFCN